MPRSKKDKENQPTNHSSKPAKPFNVKKTKSLGDLNVNPEDLLSPSSKKSSKKFQVTSPIIETQPINEKTVSFAPVVDNGSTIAVQPKEIPPPSYIPNAPLKKSYTESQVRDFLRHMSHNDLVSEYVPLVMSGILDFDRLQEKYQNTKRILEEESMSEEPMQNFWI
eukprot:TRINITY_DN7320_c0_g1_i2.p1 TRINITY_DN7320_c0_g1~~TRINITY_DN7320_c0_g1_i2.p1  ORF type:complete len:166 (-),score=22.19 TRINITY_DN7320_c0_g1_i2:56-553(-)